MEQPVQFANESATLRGILHRPDADPDVRKPGVVFLHGWTGCRLGPHRMFVEMARRLTADGFVSLRFDFRGRGESDGDGADASIRSMVSDAGAAARFLRARTGPRPIVFLGICSGGKVALGTAMETDNVAGLALWSCEPMGGLRTADMRARKTLAALGLYARKLFRPETWRKILTGRVHAAQVRSAILSSEHPDETELAWESERMKRFAAFPGRVLFVCGTADPEAMAADAAYRAFCRQHGIPSAHHAVAGANHSFYSLAWSEDTYAATRRWLAENSRS